MFSVLKLTSPVLPSLYLMIQFNVAFNMWCRCNTLMRIMQWFFCEQAIACCYSIHVFSARCSFFFSSRDLEWEQHRCPLDPASLKHHFVKLESHQTGQSPGEGLCGLPCTGCLPQYIACWSALQLLEIQIKTLFTCLCYCADLNP